MRPYCPAGSQPAERYKGRRRGTRGSRFEASHHGEGPRPQRPTESGAVGQPVSRRAERWRSRRDPAGRCRSHSRRLTRAAPRWQRSRLPPCPPQPGPAAAGRALPARRLRGTAGPGRCCPTAPTLPELPWATAGARCPCRALAGPEAFVIRACGAYLEGSHTLV